METWWNYFEQKMLSSKETIPVNFPEWASKEASLRFRYARPKSDAASKRPHSVKTVDWNVGRIEARCIKELYF